MEDNRNAYLQLNKSEDGYIVVYTLLQIGILQGKIVIYTNKGITGYRLKLFLQEFGIQSLVLCYEHPKSSRHFVVSNFVNKKVNILIIIDPDEEESPNKNCKRHHIFKTQVQALVHFDFPTNLDIYNKRLADLQKSVNSGMTNLCLIYEHDLKVLSRLNKKQQKKELPKVEHLQLQMQNFERFRYRCESVLRSITDRVAKKARVSEVMKTIIASKEVKNKLEQNPQDRQILKSLKSKKKKSKPHLQNIPDYLLPEPMRQPPKPSMKIKKVDFERNLARRQGRAMQDVDPDETIEEDPKYINYEDLMPLSNRKRWRIRHHRPIQKKPKKKQKRS